MWRTNGTERSLPLWLGALGSLIIVCLVLTLADRFRDASSVGVVDVRSSAPKVDIQHRDLVAHCWSAPVAVFFFLPPPGIRHNIFSEAPTLRFLHIEGSRYNRPPPNVLMLNIKPRS
jgi:hypothetical protein